MVQNIYQSLYSQKTAPILDSLVSYGVLIVRILEKIDRIIMEPHCITYTPITPQEDIGLMLHMSTWRQAAGCLSSVS